MLSMTGFGKAGKLFGARGVLTLEISSVNRKQFELRCNLPPEFSGLEIEIRKRVATEISRGAIQLRGSWKRADAAFADTRINDGLLRRLTESCREVRRACGLDESVAVEALTAVPGVVVQSAPDPDDPALVGFFFSVLDEALAGYRKMREAEGDALKRDLETRLELLEDTLAKIEPLVAGLPEAARARLLGKLKAEKIPVPASDEQLLKEVLFYADRADVTEEITRLKSHFGQFRGFLSSGRASGRSMDFLVQESFREITTLGNKAGAAEVSPLLVLFKSELEKLREQIQNVE
ncbi:MAG: YicC family protein [Victivallaceae bacterium]|nr:YicC family protein [Victivallaceae bacterium]